jgi:hypothetical protein
MVIGPAVEQAISKVAKSAVPAHGDTFALLNAYDAVSDGDMFTYIFGHAPTPAESGDD